MKFIKTTLAKQLESELFFAGEGIGYTSEHKYKGLDFTPRRGTDGSAGYDLRAAVEAPVTIFPDQVETIPTGVKMWIGDDIDVREQLSDRISITGLLFPRSSTKGCILNNTIGVIDSDYQGEILVKLRNITDKAITINTGDSFAQIVFMPVFLPELEETSEFDSITSRAEGGFGSTDKDQSDLLGR